MAQYLVCYDLKSSSDYAELIKAVEEFDSVHFQESVFLVNSTESAKAIYDRLIPHIHPTKDRLSVFKLDPEGPHVGYNHEMNQFLEAKSNTILARVLDRLNSTKDD